MICFPNAKINIGLNIVEKRPDGFHNLESIFYPVGLCDVLEIVKNDKGIEQVELYNTGLKISGNINDNSCVKAYLMLHEDYSILPVKIHLHKVIPFGSGLGGGSADAAFTIKCLNEIFELKLSKDKLLQYAMKIGSDCGFFIDNKVSYIEGRGEIINPVELNLSNYYIVILNPEIHISSKEAYSYVLPEKPAEKLKQKVNMLCNDWKDVVTNDFEKEILKRYPKIKECKDLLFETGAIYASMTGSGSAVYGIFDKMPKVENSAISHYVVWKGKM
ncbi:4-(cytidine 5'-diphospho)-2-C-methyl-D-erythritol kinase [Bacteroidota bacterium]